MVSSNCKKKKCGEVGMNILVTGSDGFVGQNLLENLKNIRDGKNRTRHNLKINEIFEFDVKTDDALLDEYCAKADFVFHLAGVNRPKETREYMSGNLGIASDVLELLRKHHNNCPVMLSSSIQASLSGRFENSEYGMSKLACENLFFDYGMETGAKVLIYRFPNLFGKWCRPNYNSVVATFCYNISRDLPITINNRNTELELLYIDDLVEGLLDALEGKEKYRVYNQIANQISIQEDRRYAYIDCTHNVTLGNLADMLERFRQQPKSLLVPDIPAGSFEKKLYSTYLSYLPEDKIAFELKSNEDDRGSFTELVKTFSGGQFSVNVSKPGITKGQHWHNSKWEFFIVVSGKALIQERRIGINPDTGKNYPILEFHVSGDKFMAVHMLPGYAHNIINESDDKDLVTLMWANESFDPKKPDTYGERV